MKNVLNYQYVQYIVESEETENMMIGRTETESLKRKFCSLLNKQNDVVKTTNARLYLVLSNDEFFIRHLNKHIYSAVFHESCITPIAWKTNYTTLDMIIESRDQYIKNHNNC